MEMTKCHVWSANGEFICLKHSLVMKAKILLLVKLKPQLVSQAAHSEIK